MYSILRVSPHLELIIPTITTTLLIPGVGSLGASLGTEKLPTTANTDKMSTLNGLLTVSSRFFILWEPTGRRGWLVHGDVVALLLLREYLRTIGESRVDFYSLKSVNDPSVSAYKVLNDIENLKRVYWPLEDTKEKPENSDKGKSVEGEDQVKPKVIADAMDGIYATLVEMSQVTVDVNRRHGLTGPINKWIQEKLSTTVKGWDFWDISNRKEARIYLHKLGKNPGWLHMAKELDATYLFADGIGDVFEQRAGSCCRYFPTLPEGHNFLAARMEDMQQIILQYGGTGPDDKTVARLNRDQAWERRLHPFKRQGCQGRHSIDELQPSCFPVQGLKNARIAEEPWKRKERDRILLEDKELNVYTKGEIGAMAKENPNGVVVFGRQPGVRELRDIYRRSQENTDSLTETEEKADPAAALSSNKPLSSGSSQNSTEPKAHSSPVETTPSQPEKATQTLQAGAHQRTPSIQSGRSTAWASRASGTPDSRTRQPTTPSAQRTPSTASIRSTGSTPRPRTSGTDTGDAPAAVAQSPAASIRMAASNASLRSNISTHSSVSQGRSNIVGSPVPKAASNISLRSTGSSGQPEVLQTGGIGAEHPTMSASQSGATSVHKAASKASLRSTSSSTRSVASSVRPEVPTTARQPSNSSIRTASSVASRTSGYSRLQRPSAQLPDTALKKTNTNSSHDSESSHSSRVAQNMAAFNSNLQRT